MSSKTSIKHSDLTRFPIFADLSAVQLEKIWAIIREKTYRADEEITHEGESGKFLFLLLEGEVEVSKSLTLMVGREGLDTRDKSLRRLRADEGPYFGEMVLLDEESRRTATIKALKECRVGMIDRSELLMICETDKELGYLILRNIARTMAKRLDKANQDILKLTTAFSLALQS